MSLVSGIRGLPRYAVARLDIRTERGASAVEYGLLVFLVAATIILAVVFLGRQTSGTFSCAMRSVQTNTAACGLPGRNSSSDARAFPASAFAILERWSVRAV